MLTTKSIPGTKRRTSLALLGLCASLPALSEPISSLSSDGYEEPIVTQSITEGSEGTQQTTAYAGAGTVTDDALYQHGVTVYEGTDRRIPAAEFEQMLSATDPAAAASERVVTEAILGFDARVRTYAQTYPARAIVRIHYSRGDSSYLCSGAMVSKDTVLTAGHCVHGGKNGDWGSNYRVYPGGDRDHAPYGYCEYKNLYTVKSWAERSDEKYDVGAIKLDCDVGEQVGWFATTTTNPRGLPSIVQGYPGDKRQDQWFSADKVRTVSQYQIFYPNDTVGGMSGSPVWYDNGNPVIIGVHTTRNHGQGAHGDYNHGTRINQGVQGLINNWIDAD